MNFAGNPFYFTCCVSNRWTPLSAPPAWRHLAPTWLASALSQFIFATRSASSLSLDLPSSLPGVAFAAVPVANVQQGALLNPDSISSHGCLLRGAVLACWIVEEWASPHPILLIGLLIHLLTMQEDVAVLDKAAQDGSEVQCRALVASVREDALLCYRWTTHPRSVSPSCVICPHMYTLMCDLSSHVQWNFFTSPIQVVDCNLSTLWSCEILLEIQYNTPFYFKFDNSSDLALFSACYSRFHQEPSVPVNWFGLWSYLFKHLEEFSCRIPC
jgi:hypothetical protein